MKKLILLFTILMLTSCTGVGLMVYDDYVYEGSVYHHNYRVVKEVRICPVCHGTGKIRTSIGPRYGRHRRYRFSYCNRYGGTGRIHVNRFYNRYLY